MTGTMAADAKASVLSAHQPINATNDSVTNSERTVSPLAIAFFWPSVKEIITSEDYIIFCGERC